MSYNMVLVLLQSLFNKLGIIVLIAFFISRSSLIKGYISKTELNLGDKIVFSIIFGGLGIVGTYSGIPIQGAIANSRSIGVVVAGIFGGPFVGIAAGLIAGIHRMFMKSAEFTALSCGLSTILGGVIAGYAKPLIMNSKKRWLSGALLTIGIEAIQMGMILLLAKPYTEAVDLVKVIFIPMAFINAFGTGSFIMLIDQITQENEYNAARKASLALKIATQTLPILRNGLNKKSAHDASVIIKDITGVSAVSFTNCSRILAHVGSGLDHHGVDELLHTDITKKAIETRHYIIAQTKADIECSEMKCELQSAIVVPLFLHDNVIGTFKLYRDVKNGISPSDIEMAKGLGYLFSTQLELSQIEYLKQLSSKAEIKALQAQIHPHFLFNALNTIISFCRTDANKARVLLTKLSLYLRAGFAPNEAFVPFEQEIQHIKNYLDIEEARFSHRLEVAYEIESDITCMVPPLLIQPLVENALKHGLRDCQSGGVLTIKAGKTEDGLLVTVHDNGMGMDQSIRMAVLNGSETIGGIGLQNVRQRLLALYETDIIIESSEGEGTLITFIIPKDRYKIA